MTEIVTLALPGIEQATKGDARPYLTSAVRAYDQAAAKGAAGQPDLEAKRAGLLLFLFEHRMARGEDVMPEMIAVAERLAAVAKTAPRHPGVLRNLCSSWLRVQSWSTDAALQLRAGLAAVVPMTALTELVPNEPYYHDTLGVLLAKLGRYEEAEGPFARALELEPDNTSYAGKLAACRERLGKK